MSLTIGDLIVALVTAGSVLSGYHAVKNQMTTFLSTQNSHGVRLDRHEERLGDHDVEFVRVRELWGRRRGDIETPGPDF